jgi:hypothetical protein
MTARPVSTQATSGAGTVFGYRVAAIMLGRLLRGAQVPFGTAQPLARVGLQRGNAGYPFDDIVAHTLPRQASPVVSDSLKRRCLPMNVHGIARAVAIVLSQDSRTRRISAASAGVCRRSLTPLPLVMHAGLARLVVLG